MRMVMVPKLAGNMPVIIAYVGHGSTYLSECASAGLSAPQVIPVPLLVDTGATISSISHATIQQLGIAPTGSTAVRTAERMIEKPTYEVSIYISTATESTPHRTITVVDYDHDPNNPLIHGLLGWDVLEHCSFYHDKDTKNFSIAF